MALAKQYAEAKQKTHYSEAEYFEFERTSFGRWESVNGEIRQMAGGKDDHNTIAINLARALGNVLTPKGCRVYGSDMKIRTGDGVNTFPDVAAVCGERQYYLGKEDVILNPLMIAEVLPPSTESYDRGDKFAHYQSIASLQDYLLVETHQARVRIYSRQGDHWEMREIAGLDSAVHLPSVGVDLALKDVYALIELDGNDLGAEREDTR
jgi:Uma2 family endonuclease